ncbi:MAG: hypothetical protein ACXU82_03720 [Caulobacteraceae bacterium]
MSTDLAFDVVELAPYAPPATTGPLREVAFRKDAWLPSEISRLISLFGADTPMEDIASELGRGRAGVSDKIYSLGLRRNSTRPWSELEERELVRRYKAEPCARIAQDLGRGVSAVYMRAQLLGLSEPNAPIWDPWEDAQLAAGYQQGIAVGQLSALIGRPFGGVIARASRLGLRHKHKPADWTEDEMARALELAHGGDRYLVIIEQLVAEGFPRRSKIGFGLTIRKLGYGRGWGKAWTPDEDELLRRAYAAGDSLVELGSRMGRSKHSLKWRAEELALQGSHPKPDGWRGRIWTDEEEAILRADYGLIPSRQLAKKLDRDLAAVYTRANVLKLKHPWCRGFTEEEDEAIKVAWRVGFPLVRLAAAMDRDQAVVSKHAIRMGYAFNDPARPVPADRHGPRYTGPLHTLADILAMDGSTHWKDAPPGTGEARRPPAHKAGRDLTTTDPAGWQRPARAPPRDLAVPAAAPAQPRRAKAKDPKWKVRVAIRRLQRRQRRRAGGNA